MGARPDFSFSIGHLSLLFLSLGWIRSLALVSLSESRTLIVVLLPITRYLIRSYFEGAIALFC